jgi:hypothetical protein
MAEITLEYVNSFTDARGKRRHQFRRKEIIAKKNITKSIVTGLLCGVLSTSAFARDEHPDIRDKTRRVMVCSGHTVAFQGNNVQFDNLKGEIGRFNGRSLKFFVDGDMYVADFTARSLDTPDNKTLTCDQKQ